MRGKSRRSGLRVGRLGCTEAIQENSSGSRENLACTRGSGWLHGLARLALTLKRMLEMAVDSADRARSWIVPETQKKNRQN
ncbi:hypothetical protein CDL15_Pgr002562 [Punica granatum]|uniref:Uncharacterized protein n=1 Tax=Punica granatum TaxID=22663 RepID=A0A218X6I8_PUNGR|nr:hypothetical protein CDL15_Pgr002562 [Punica granatum]